MASTFREKSIIFAYHSLENLFWGSILVLWHLVDCVACFLPCCTFESLCSQNTLTARHSSAVVCLPLYCRIGTTWAIRYKNYTSPLGLLARVFLFDRPMYFAIGGVGIRWKTRILSNYERLLYDHLLAQGSWISSPAVCAQTGTI